MTLQQLEYVVILERFRNFVKASNYCKVTQPTLTIQLKKLEQEIGFSIFDRTNSPLKPTLNGESFIEQSKAVLGEFNNLKALVFKDTESIEGEFKLGIIPTIAPYLLPRFLPKFKENYPTTNLIIEEIQTNQLISKLKSDDMDFGILSTPIEEKNIQEHVIYDEPLVAYLHPTHPMNSNKTISQENLTNNDLLILQQGHCFRNQMQKLCSKSENQVELRYESGSIETLKRLVDRNMGYTLIPELAIEKHDLSNHKYFQNPIPSREISIVTHIGFNRLALLDLLKNVILKSLPENIKKKKQLKRIPWKA